MCWGGNGGQSPPLGHFDAVSVGGGSACAIRVDSTVACWSVDQNDPAPQPPDGYFQSISIDTGIGCGIRLNGTVDCWGFEDTSPLRPPQGTFISVVVADTYACGIRTGGQLECWGDPTPMEPLPEGLFASIASDFPSLQVARVEYYKVENYLVGVTKAGVSIPITLQKPYPAGLICRSAPETNMPALLNRRVKSFAGVMMATGALHHPAVENDRLHQNSIVNECGWGHTDRARVPGMLESHRRAVEYINAE